MDLDKSRNAELAPKLPPHDGYFDDLLGQQVGCQFTGDGGGVVDEVTVKKFRADSVDEPVLAFKARLGRIAAGQKSNGVAATPTLQHLAGAVEMRFMFTSTVAPASRPTASRSLGTCQQPSTSPELCGDPNSNLALNTVEY